RTSGVPAHSPAPAPTKTGQAEPATVPRSDVSSGGFGSLARSALRFDQEHRYVLVVAEGPSLIGLRIHRGIAMWRHPIPDGPVWLAVFGRTVLVAAGQALSSVDLVTGEVGIR